MQHLHPVNSVASDIGNEETGADENFNKKHLRFHLFFKNSSFDVQNYLFNTFSFTTFLA